MKKASEITINVPWFLICLIFCSGCITPKDTAVSRKLQNLTARYNYIYNAKVLLADYNIGLQQSYRDNYQTILPIYLDPPPQKELVLLPDAPNKPLDEVIKKAQAIINEKSYSDYVDDAYLLLGKASYLKGNYFAASAYFDYAAKTFAKDKKTVITALDWKARSQMELNNLGNADKILDTLFLVSKDYKKSLAEPQATSAQLRIYQNRYNEAAVLLQEALRKGNDRLLKIRWRFILAQLQQKQNNIQDAFKNFTNVARSNGPFEMYFQANLQRIKIRAQISGKQIDEEKELLRLVKDDKNADYIDQIYGQIGELFAQKGDFSKAEFYFEKSVQSSTNNINQKALSYLNIANVNFAQLKNYRKAKLYYDSAVNILPKSFNDYNKIAKKAANLQYLTDRYTLIDVQDTLQFIAKLPLEERKPNIHRFVQKEIDTLNGRNNLAQNPAIANNAFLLQDNDLPNPSVGNGSTFYFSNPAAVSKGFTDFKIRWGNRTLQDNWRQSIQSSAQQNNQILAGGDVILAAKPLADSTDFGTTKPNDLETEYLSALPTTDSLLKVSNQKIIDAYYEIASFYQQELNDKEEAAKVYQILLARFPNNNHRPAILYSLYLSNKGKDELKANVYRDEVLTSFPNSDYAKTIRDPYYASKQDALLDTAKKTYENLYHKFIGKNYKGVIDSVSFYFLAHPESEIDPQFAYLKALSIGRTSKVPMLIDAFNKIDQKYPDDKVVVPLVRSQLEYINTHLADFEQRTVALLDFDENARDPLSSVIDGKPRPSSTAKPTKIVQPPAGQIADKANNSKTAFLPKTDSATTTLSIKKPSIFSTAVSAEYYYVIDVRDATLTVSSSRFGIGQFNRGNYPDNDLVHKLIELDDDQLIYINSFVDLSDAKIYESSIKNQLNKIMKVPNNNYETFIISKENFEKLLDRKRIDSYLEFYRENY
ncbi:tetratricopeptide (TPR) repeat protein [Pedobacter sp. UYP30]|uniref:type IX secretion system periplasmic lipoprotein PorW/SprE n=1 Tax=Pedobacter sp. UYP30 TaxID=1756400 RepID=UPI003390FB0E